MTAAPALPAPACSLGYTKKQVGEILPGRLEEAFWQWMRGQTMAICEGRDGVAHGSPIVYPHDLQRFLAHLPTTD